MPPRLLKSPLGQTTRKATATSENTIHNSRKTRQGALSTASKATDDKSAASATTQTTSPRNRPRVKKSATETSRTTPPNDWEIVYEKIKNFRSLPQNVAPVDVLGCERLADPKVRPKNYRWQTLVSLMLSSQTKDAVTAEAVGRLNEAAKNQGREFDAQFILDLPPKTLDECISKVGFHNRKTGYLQSAAKVCIDTLDGDIPDTLEGLVALPGVGPKMAFLALQCAWEINAGVGVDTHVHRIGNRLGWVNSKDPEGTRKQLEGWLPSTHWREINPLLVGFGQIHCLPRGPRCETCPVESYCPGSEVSLKIRKKRKVVVKEEADLKVELLDEVGYVKVKVEDDDNAEKQEREVNTAVKLDRVQWRVKREASPGRPSY